MNKCKQLLSIILLLFIFASYIPTEATAASVPLVKQVATVTASSLRLRSGPSTGSSVIATAPKGDYVMITGSSGSWYRVSYNLKQGYMHKDYLKSYDAKNTELGYGTVMGDRVNMRTGPGTSYSVKSQAKGGTRAYIIGFNKQWYKVIYGDDICYIRSDYLQLTQIPYENQASANTPLFFRNGISTGIAPSSQALSNQNTSVLRQRIIAEAKQHIGVPYLWGGNTPEGFDCSGFTRYVLNKCGISLPRTTTEQYQSGSYISKAALLPGDLVFLANTYRQGISHVGIYLGNNQMIHASSSKGVTISNLSSSYYLEHYYGCRRIVN